MAYSGLFLSIVFAMCLLNVAEASKQEDCFKVLDKTPNVINQLAGPAQNILCKDAPTADGPIKCFQKIQSDKKMIFKLPPYAIAKLCSGAKDGTPGECFRTIYYDRSIVGVLQYEAEDRVINLCSGAWTSLSIKCVKQAFKDYDVGDCSSSTCGKAETVKIILEECAASKIE